MSKFIEGQTKRIAGTVNYVAPEVLMGAMSSPGSDLWAVGIMLYTMFCGGYPFDHENEKKLIKLIIQTEPSFKEPIWNTISDQAKDLVKKLLSKDPAHRLNHDTILQHPWYKTMEMRESSLDALNDVPEKYQTKNHEVKQKENQTSSASCNGAKNSKGQDDESGSDEDADVRSRDRSFSI